MTMEMIRRTRGLSSETITALIDFARETESASRSGFSPWGDFKWMRAREQLMIAAQHQRSTR